MTFPVAPESKIKGLDQPFKALIKRDKKTKSHNKLQIIKTCFEALNLTYCNCGNINGYLLV